jgi:hypothetical protein
MEAAVLSAIMTSLMLASRRRINALSIARQQGRSGDAEKLLQRIEAAYPGLRSSQVRRLFRRFRKPEHRELFDRWLSSLALPA